MVAQIVNAFQAVQESYQRKDKRMSVGKLSSGHRHDNQSICDIFIALEPGLTEGRSRE